MSTDYIRRCPTCDVENAPEVMRCGCGAMLAGVDLVRKVVVLSATEATDGATPFSGAAPSPSQGEGWDGGSEAAIRTAVIPQAHYPLPNPPPARGREQDTSGAGILICPFEDCAQPNPAGSESCVYCNRPLAPDTQLSPPGQLHSLVNLPAALRTRYRILRPLPTQGAEAELLLVKALTGGPACIAKIYRHGILPKREVQERIARMDVSNRVDVFESGISDGHAYDLMEFCTHGSLRDRMKTGPLPAKMLLAMVRELASAVADVHAAGLVHRDLKPENILVRTDQPLDLVLTDFGISSVLDVTQRFTGVARTLPYASPESLSGVIDGKADYWALGMIILEAAAGKHPFAELSEAVILHHLTTRSVDVLGVADGNLRKLVRGLLLRDPKQRWGADEIRRWLAGDASLLEPAEHSPGAGFAQPYHIAKEVCHTSEQLAVALARNWREGIADIANGQLLSWFRDAQKDQNAVRVILETRHDNKVPVDVQLLKLILHLAPGIPPVWRGETIDLPAILSHANLALKGDAEAAHWLDLLYQYRVVDAYAKAGNEQAEQLLQRWHLACDQFENAWEEMLALIKTKAPERGPHEYVNFDEMMYGGGGPHCPSLSTMHARLLAIAYDKSWAERLRQRLIAELTGLTVYCPGFSELGDPRSMDAPSLLVLESLLPEARKVADRQIKADERRQEAELNECNELHSEIATVFAELRVFGSSRMITAGICDELVSRLDRYFGLLARVRQSGRSDLPWQDMKKHAVRGEKIASHMRMLVDTLTERRAVNAGWLSREVLVFFVLSLLLMPLFFGQRIAYVLLALGAGLLAWRLLPNMSITKEIRMLAKAL